MRVCSLEITPLRNPPLGPQQRAELSPCTMYDFYDSTDIFFYIHHFCHFVPKRYPELALKTGILVPNVAYDLLEFKVRP